MKDIIGMYQLRKVPRKDLYVVIHIESGDTCCKPLSLKDALITLTMLKSPVKRLVGGTGGMLDRNIRNVMFDMQKDARTAKMRSLMKYPVPVAAVCYSFHVIIDGFRNDLKVRCLRGGGDNTNASIQEGIRTAMMNLRQIAEANVQMRAARADGDVQENNGAGMKGGGLEDIIRQAMANVAPVMATAAFGNQSTQYKDYPGTDTITPTVAVSDVDSGSQYARMYADSRVVDRDKEWWEQLGDFFVNLGNAFVSFLVSIGNFLKDAIMAIVDIVKGLVLAVVDYYKAMGELIAGVFTGDLERIKNSASAMLTSVDTIAKQIPGLNVISAAGHIIAKAATGQEITADDWMELGTSCLDTVVTVATLGTGTAAVRVATTVAKTALKTATKGATKSVARTATKQAAKSGTKSAAKQAPKTTAQQGQDVVKKNIRDKIKEELVDMSIEALDKKAASIILENDISLHPEKFALYIFKSQITGDQRTVILSPYGADKVDPSVLPDGFENLDPAVDEFMNPNRYSERMDGKVKIGRDYLQYTATPAYAKFMFKNVIPTQHNRIVQEMMRDDRQALEENTGDTLAGLLEEELPVLIPGIRKKIANGFDYKGLYVKTDEIRAILKKTGKDLDVMFKDMGVNDYQDIVDMYQEQIEGTIEGMNADDEEYVEKTVEEVLQMAPMFALKAVDKILLQIGEAGGEVTQDQFDVMVQTAVQTAKDETPGLAEDILRGKVEDALKATGKSIPDSEKVILKLALIDAVSADVQEQAFEALFPLTYAGQVEELNDMQAEYDEAIEGIKLLKEKYRNSMELVSDLTAYSAPTTDDNVKTGLINLGPYKYRGRDATVADIRKAIALVEETIKKYTKIIDEYDKKSKEIFDKLGNQNPTDVQEHVQQQKVDLYKQQFAAKYLARDQEIAQKRLAEDAMIDRNERRQITMLINKNATKEMIQDVKDEYADKRLDIKEARQDADELRKDQDEDELENQLDVFDAQPIPKPVQKTVDQLRASLKLSIDLSKIPIPEVPRAPIGIGAMAGLAQQNNQPIMASTTKQAQRMHGGGDATSDRIEREQRAYQIQIHSRHGKREYQQKINDFNAAIQSSKRGFPVYTNTSKIPEPHSTQEGLQLEEYPITPEKQMEEIKKDVPLTTETKTRVKTVMQKLREFETGMTLEAEEAEKKRIAEIKPELDLKVPKKPFYEPGKSTTYGVSNLVYPPAFQVRGTAV